MTYIVAVLAPRDSSCAREYMLPPIVDSVTDRIVRRFLVQAFRRLLPCMN